MLLKHRILLAAKNEHVCDIIKELIDPSECAVVTATDGNTLRSITLDDFDTIIISMPLENESGLELISDLRERTYADIIILIKSDHVPVVHAKAVQTGAYIVEKPLGKGSVMQAIHFIEMSAEHEIDMRRRLDEAEKEIEELHLLYRAKLLLIEKEGMSESDAHKLIQQRAMNERRSLRAVSVNIINEYE